MRFGYENRPIALSSSFATHIADRLARARFHVTANPTGILFNPLSIAAAVRAFGTEVRRDELQHDAERWFHFGFHGDFAVPTAEEALRRMNAARTAGAEALRTADRVILTLGTAWVYERNGEVVANCHRRPAAEFTRRMVSVEEIVGTLSELIEGPLADKELLLTVSPVRHLGDGLAGNAVSKATLRLAAEELAGRFRRVAYFPSYEILLDDLRDYRFYADDLVHPAPQAVEYIWERFVAAALTETARKLQPAVEEIVAAAPPRPRDPKGRAHRDSSRRQRQRIAALEGPNFRADKEYSRRCIEINS